jgi:hypothetical protein
MKTIVPILLGILQICASSAHAAADGQDKAALTELSSGKRAAALKLTLGHGAGRTGTCAYEAFISKDGLALVAMEAVTTAEEPAVTKSIANRRKCGRKESIESITGS